jgi:hypothetical protein
MLRLNAHVFAAVVSLAGMLAAAGCGPKRIPPMTVADLMEDRVTLDGVLMKCNQNPDRARNDTDCLNARIAIERLAEDVDPTESVKRNAEFERNREQLRQAQERERADQESKARVDPYNLPVVPVDPAAPVAPAGEPTVGALAKP